MATLGRAFLDESARYLRDVYVPRLERALQTLPADDFWWRPHDDVLAFGTILLHLEGNVRQWIVSGLGGAADQRDRAAEFAATDGPPGEELLATLGRTVQDACDVIEHLGPDQLLAQRRIQGDLVTVHDAIYHVVEHFAWHTGQAVWIAKARAGAGHTLHFFDDAQINTKHNG